MEPFFFNYCVSFGEEEFTVTEPNDLVFLDYFLNRVPASGGRRNAPAGKIDPALVRLDDAAGMTRCRYSPQVLASVASQQPSQ